MLSCLNRRWHRIIGNSSDFDLLGSWFFNVEGDWVPYSAQASWDLEVARLLGKTTVTVQVCEPRQDISGRPRRRHVMVDLQQGLQMKAGKRSGKGRVFRVKRLPADVLGVENRRKRTGRGRAVSSDGAWRGVCVYGGGRFEVWSGVGVGAAGNDSRESLQVTRPCLLAWERAFRPEQEPPLEQRPTRCPVPVILWYDSTRYFIYCTCAYHFIRYTENTQTGSHGQEAINPKIPFLREMRVCVF